MNLSGKSVPQLLVTQVRYSPMQVVQRDVLELVSLMFAKWHHKGFWRGGLEKAHMLAAACAVKLKVFDVVVDLFARF
jgi:hypothetical protein